MPCGLCTEVDSEGERHGVGIHQVIDSTKIPHHVRDSAPSAPSVGEMVPQVGRNGIDLLRGHSGLPKAAAQVFEVVVDDRVRHLLRRCLLPHREPPVVPADARRAPRRWTISSTEWLRRVHSSRSSSRREAPAFVSW